jgi:hypothetical protein
MSVEPKLEGHGFTGAYPRQSYFSYLLWSAAGLLLLDAVFRLSHTPHQASLGEGDVKALDAAIYCWKSLGIATVLISLGFYLSRRKTAKTNRFTKEQS